MKKGEDIIKGLTSISAISGREFLCSQTIMNSIKSYCDTATIDTLGNLIAFKKGNGKNKLTVLFEAHFDQIGLIVTKIEKNGIIRFSKIGGLNPKALYGKRIKLYGKEIIYGVIGTKPPHLMSNTEINKIESFNEMYIDCGYNFEEIQDKIQVGDVGVICDYPQKMLDSVFSSSGLDNKASALILIETIELLKGKQPYHDVYFLFSVQEEVGCRGAKVGAYTIEPDIAIICDVTFAEPLGSPFKLGLGKGPSIVIGPAQHIPLVKKLQKLCDTEDIPYQTETENRPEGTDLAPIQVNKKGVYTSLLSIPISYMHTQVEMVHLKDIYRSARLLTCFSCEESLFEEENENA